MILKYSRQIVKLLATLSALGMLLIGAALLEASDSLDGELRREPKHHRTHNVQKSNEQ